MLMYVEFLLYSWELYSVSLALWSSLEARPVSLQHPHLCADLQKMYRVQCSLIPKPFICVKAAMIIKTKRRWSMEADGRHIIPELSSAYHEWDAHVHTCITVYIEIFTNYITTCSHWWKFNHANFLSCVKDCIVHMATFTALTKLLFSENFYTYGIHVSGVFLHRAQQGVSPPPKVYRNLIEILLLDGFLGTQV